MRFKTIYEDAVIFLSLDIFMIYKICMVQKRAAARSDILHAAA